MKKITLPLLAALLGFTSVNAQEGKPYNKWSLEFNGGLSKPSQPMTAGSYSDTFFGFVHADAGVRYMFNNKFGMKADFGYDYMKNGENSDYFRNTHYRASLQGVANLGRIMNFEEWTNTFGLLAHIGAGYSWMEPGKELSSNIYEKDQMGHMIVGLTGQVRLGNRVSLNADFSMINTSRQNVAFDGASFVNSDSNRAFTGTLYNATLGLSFYLGGNDVHADWYANDGLTNRVNALENRVTDIENKMIDSDNDGVADYLDLEPNTPAGNMVDTKGRSIDLNKNGIPDSYEDYFDSRYAKKGENQTFTSEDSNTAGDLINQGYVAVYFDFDKSTPKNTEATNFIITYLRSNPNATVEVNGFADSVGNAQYNQRLSERRAKNVAKILEQAGVSSSRIKVNANGEDTSFDGANKTASKFARRVTFKVN